MTSRLGSPNRSPHRAFLAAVPTLALFACGGDSAPIADAVVEDSAGVQIIQYAQVPEVDPPFALADEPTYRHGDDPDHYSFGRIGEGRLFPDGRAALADVANTEVIVLSSDGSRHDILAREGQGPGEIDYVTDMFVLGPDSLLLLDRNQSRFSLFANGSLAHTASIVDLRRTTSLWPKGIDATGRFLVSTGSFRSGFEEEWLYGHLARYDPESGAVDTVASYKFVSGASNPIPGMGRVIVSGGQFIYVRSDNPEVVWYLADGTMRQIVRWQLERRYMTEEYLEGLKPTLRDRLRFANPGMSDERLEEVTMEHMARYEADLGNPISHFSPPFADAEGRVWLPTFIPGGPREGVPPYTVISPEGEWLGMGDGPPGLRILDVGWGRVLGIVADQAGAESVVVYELVAAN